MRNSLKMEQIHKAVIETCDNLCKTLKLTYNSIFVDEPKFYAPPLPDQFKHTLTKEEILYRDDLWKSILKKSEDNKQVHVDILTRRCIMLNKFIIYDKENLELLGYNTIDWSNRNPITGLDEDSFCRITLSRSVK